MTTDQKWIERVEQARDLRGQLNDLGSEEMQEVQFTEWSPGRKIVTLWSLETGEEVPLPRYIAAAALSARDQSGKYRFTSDQSKAPTLKVGSVKCFLHRDAPERVILDEIGVTRTCPAEHLSSNGAKRVHAQNRHKSEWAQYQEYIQEQEAQSYKEQQTRQTDALLRLAGERPVTNAAQTSQELLCPQCDFTAKNNFGLQAHIRGKHKET